VQPVRPLVSDEGVSLKALARSVESWRNSWPLRLSFAGTIDLVTCGGFTWGRYRDYLAVQLSQARFLGCSEFRFFSGPYSSSAGTAELSDRIRDFVSVSLRCEHESRSAPDLKPAPASCDGS
jgi:hypothetical protein